MELNDLLKTTEVAIPETDIKILIRGDLSWHDHIEAMKIEDKDERGIFVMTKMIQSWNIQSGGKDLEITEEVIKKLPKNVVQPILARVNQNLFPDEKKNQSSEKS